MTEYVDCRVCNKCGEMKTLDEFATGKGYLYGRRPTCKSCWNEEMRMRRLLLKNASPEKKKLFMTIEKVWILATHGYSIREIYKLLTEKF